MARIIDAVQDRRVDWNDDERWAGGSLDLLVALPARFIHGDRSIRDLFLEADPPLDDESLESRLYRAFVGHADAVAAWQRYSYDKRVSSGPYLHHCQVGWYEHGTHDVRTHSSLARACADFVRREACSVLRRQRVS